MPNQPENCHRHAAPTRKADKALGERCEAAVPPDYPLVYVWGNNACRAAFQGQRCRPLVAGKLGSILLEFTDGSRLITSRRAVRRAAGAATTR